MTFPHGLEAADEADLVIAPAYGGDVDGAAVGGRPRRLPPRPRPRRVGALGLLGRLPPRPRRAAGRPRVHHPLAAHRRAACRCSPPASIDPDVLFVEDDRVITSAGTAAGIDACLHHVRCELGAGVANKIARRMVVPPQRDGGQRQYIDLPVPDCDADSLSPLLTWMREHLAEDLPVRDAGQARRHVRAHLRPALRGRDRYDAGQVAARPAAAPRPRAAGVHGPAGGDGRRAGPASGRPRCCATTSARTSASRRPSTGAPSGPRRSAPAEPHPFRLVTVPRGDSRGVHASPRPRLILPRPRARQPPAARRVQRVGTRSGTAVRRHDDGERPVAAGHLGPGLGDRAPVGPAGPRRRGAPAPAHPAHAAGRAGSRPLLEVRRLPHPPHRRPAPEGSVQQRTARHRRRTSCSPSTSGSRARARRVLLRPHLGRGRPRQGHGGLHPEPPPRR